MIGKHNYNTRINHHLIKDGPLYRVKNREYTVKLLKAYNTVDGVQFTAEIINSTNKGKWTTVKKSELSRINGIAKLKEVI
jgi:hypothetical protein